jgi:hypothetical protein
LAQAVLKSAGMRFVAVLAVLAIVSLLLTRHSPVESAKDAVAQAEAVAPTPAPAAPAAAPTPTALRRPIARTHAVLDQVKTRNGAGEF